MTADCLPPATAMAKPGHLNVASFKHYDQALLWAALQAGHLFAVIVEGPNGPKVAYVSEKDPSDRQNCPVPQRARVVRVDHIDGLGDSASGPDALAGMGHGAATSSRSRLLE